jgi:hypothetical protein
VLQDSDGGDVGQGLGGVDIGWLHFARFEVEQVEGADDAAPATAWARRAPSGSQRLGSRPRKGASGWWVWRGLTA